MGSELKKCYDAIIVYINIKKALKEAAKKWWVNPFEN